MVNLNEDFKPAGKYTGYLLLATLAGIVLVWAACCAWMFIDSIFRIFLIIGIAALAVCVIFACIWAPLYYKSVVYHLNGTEMTWKRGVFFRKTGIVPYNRITNVDIVQGPVMRCFLLKHKCQVHAKSNLQHHQQNYLSAIEIYLCKHSPLFGQFLNVFFEHMNSLNTHKIYHQ